MCGTTAQSAYSRATASTHRLEVWDWKLASLANERRQVIQSPRNLFS
jgi:hypothetical protein